MLYGYAGKILRINLSTGVVEIEDLSRDLVRDYIGGRGFVAKIAYDEIPAGADPLGEENKLVMAAGPLSGLFVPAGGKTHFGAKSPATGIYGDSNMGGHFAAEMKYAGYDLIILEGCSPKPSYIYIDDERVEIRDAGKYWGKGALEGEKLFKEDLGEDFQIAMIGPAGENLVKFACISHDFGRQAGRTGMGTVMGSKKVKAIVVRGSKTIPVADVGQMITRGKEVYQACFNKANLDEWQDYGTAGVTTWVNEIGAFPTRNFQTAYHEDHARLAGPLMREEIVVTDKGCFGCPSPCGKYSHSKGKNYDVYVEGPEYETNALIGGNCAFDNIQDVAYGNYLCDELGLDTISAGAVVSFALEALEKQLIKPEDVGNRKLKFGDLESFKYLVEAIAYRQGLGDLLAGGVKHAAGKLGGGAEKFAIQVKGLEWSGYEARNAPSQMLAYATCDVGAHHNRAWSITHDLAVGRDVLEGKAAKVIELQHIRPFFDLLGCCRLQWVEIALELDYYPGLFAAVTGRELSLQELLQVSERVWNLTRAFSIKHRPGFGRPDDMPPARFLEETVPTGPSSGKLVSQETLDLLLDEYYSLRGWTAGGIPTPEKLTELGLDFVVGDLDGGRKALGKVE